jgi:hypothetical protein
MAFTKQQIGIAVSVITMWVLSYSMMILGAVCLDASDYDICGTRTAARFFVILGGTATFMIMAIFAGLFFLMNM